MKTHVLKNVSSFSPMTLLWLSYDSPMTLLWLSYDMPDDRSPGEYPKELRCLRGSKMSLLILRLHTIRSLSEAHRFRRNHVGTNYYYCYRSSSSSISRRPISNIHLGVCVWLCDNSLNTSRSFSNIFENHSTILEVSRKIENHSTIFENLSKIIENHSTILEGSSSSI